MIIIELLDRTKTCGTQGFKVISSGQRSFAPQIVLKSEPVQIVIAKSEKIWGSPICTQSGVLNKQIIFECSLCKAFSLNISDMCRCQCIRLFIWFYIEVLSIWCLPKLLTLSSFNLAWVTPPTVLMVEKSNYFRRKPV